MNIIDNRGMKTRYALEWESHGCKVTGTMDAYDVDEVVNKALRNCGPGERCDIYDYSLKKYVADVSNLYGNKAANIYKNF